MNPPRHPAVHLRRNRRGAATLRASHGIAILLVEQDIDFLCALSDRILVLEKAN